MDRSDHLRPKSAHAFTALFTLANGAVATAIRGSGAVVCIGMSLGTTILLCVQGRHGKPAHRVLFSGHRFEVNRIYAIANPAKVIQLQPIRNRPNEFLIGEPVSHNRLATNSEMAVPLSIARCNPQPAFVGLDDFRPEALGCGGARLMLPPSEVMHVAQPASFGRTEAVGGRAFRHSQILPFQVDNG